MGSAASKALPKSLDFLKDIPVVDIAATGVASELQSRDDMNNGWSPGHARSADYGAGGIGLAGGAGAGVLAGAASVSTGGAAAIGGIAAVGIGDFAYQGFHEHWSEDIHKHGVVGGVLTGVGHMGENTGKDVWGMMKGVGHGAASLWHSVFG